MKSAFSTFYNLVCPYVNVDQTYVINIPNLTNLTYNVVSN